MPFTLVNALARWMVNANHTSAHSPVNPNQVPTFNNSRTPNDKGRQLIPHMKRMRSAQSVDEYVQVTYPAPPQQASWSLDIPRTVVCTLQQGSTVTSMNFNPSLHSLLAVGCVVQMVKFHFGKQG